MPESQWVFEVRGSDRPGALAAIATAFSSRGVSIDSVIAVATAGERARRDHNIVLGVRCTEARRDEMVRVLSRMSFVETVTALPMASPRVVALAFAWADCEPGPCAKALLQGGRDAVLAGPAESMRALAHDGDLMVAVLPERGGAPT